MSGAAQGDNATTKAIVSDTKDNSQPLAQKPVTQLEEDDEFEDFPVEGTPTKELECRRQATSKTVREMEQRANQATDWPTEEELGSSGTGTTHLWEESWDDDDTSNEFSVQLKYVCQSRAAPVAY